MIKIDNRKIGQGYPSFIVAELSANHGQDLDIALATIDAAAECGADAIKLQTVIPDRITIDCDNPYFRITDGTLWAGKTLYQLEVETHLPLDWHQPLIERAKQRGLLCFSSPFDTHSVEFLQQLDMPAYKIASFELTDIELIAKVAKTGKPIIMSTGIATMADIETAIQTCVDCNNDQILLLKCTSAYPTPMTEVNLRGMLTLKNAFGYDVGVSDHTMGSTIPIAATALGSCFIEKHFILDRNIDSADASFSMNPIEFKHMVNSVRDAEAAMGNGKLDLTRSMKKGREFSRSLFCVETIEAGEVITADHVRSIRPGFGILPKYLGNVIGKKASKRLERGQPIQFGDFI